MTPPYAVVYVPACCPARLKTGKCEHPEERVSYHTHTLAQAREAQVRVGGTIYHEGREIG